MTPKRKLKNDENLFVFKAQTQIDKINCQDAMVELEGDLELELSNLMDIKDELTTKIAKYNRLIAMCHNMTPIKKF